MYKEKNGTDTTHQSRHLCFWFFPQHRQQCEYGIDQHEFGVQHQCAVFLANLGNIGVNWGDDLDRQHQDQPCRQSTTVCRP